MRDAEWWRRITAPPLLLAACGWAAAVRASLTSLTNWRTSRRSSPFMYRLDWKSWFSCAGSCSTGTFVDSASQCTTFGLVIARAPRFAEPTPATIPPRRAHWPVPRSGQRERAGGEVAVAGRRCRVPERVCEDLRSLARSRRPSRSGRGRCASRVTASRRARASRPGAACSSSSGRSRSRTLRRARSACRIRLAKALQHRGRHRLFAFHRQALHHALRSLRRPLAYRTARP
jgi:hypothetical protein